MPTSKKPNQPYLNAWDCYQQKVIEARLKDKSQTGVGREPILLPVAISITEDGILTRERLTASEVKKAYAKNHKDFPEYLRNPDLGNMDVDKIFKDYINYFQSCDDAHTPLESSAGGVKNSGGRTPLDLSVAMPVLILYYLKPKAWTFTKDCQYSVVGDRDDMRRNFEKICTLGNMKYLLLHNRCRSAPKNLKFNLHVTITQKLGRKKMKTPIIIDPDQTNNDGNGGWGQQ